MSEQIIPNVVVSMPSQLFTLARKFQAASNGKIFIGKIDSDPTIPENQIQVYLQNEDGTTVPVSQPLIINQAGYPVYNGQTAKFVTVQGHSMAVYDSYGSQQFYYPNVLKYDPDQFEQRFREEIGTSMSTLPLFEGVYDVFVIYGQSNAVGFAGADDGFSTADLVSLSSKAMYFNGEVLAPLTHYMEHSSGDVSTGSPWDQFANRYTSLTGRGVIFIPCAKSGVGIDNLLPGGVFYSNARSYIYKFDSLDKGVEIGKRYIVFHQGEQDQLSAKDRSIYQSELNLLISNMVIDFNCEMFYILKVGNPITRSERLWTGVQNAQEFLSSTEANCMMATRICTSFNLENKLIGSDKTHYSQKGYNLMGDDAAVNIAHDLNNKTRVSNYGLDKHSSLLLPGQKMWNYLSGYVSWEGDLNSFVINTSNNTDGIYSVSNFTDIIFNQDKKSFLLKSSAMIASILNIDVKVNNVGNVNGVSIEASRYDDRNINLDFYLDADFYINMNSGQILGLDTGVAPGWIAGNVSISLDKDKSTAVITHGESNFFPSIHPANTPSLDNIKTDVSFRRLSRSSFIVKTTPVDYNVIMVSIRKMKINAGTARIPGLGFYVTAITSEI